MAQYYSDPRREDDIYALPDIETFQVTLSDPEPLLDEDGEPLPLGWYWWACFPGCLPDGSPHGPFDTEDEAVADARDQSDIMED